MKYLNTSLLKNASFIIVALLLLTITALNQKIDTAASNNISTVNYTANSAASQENANSSQAASVSAEYTVKEHDGVIAVFKEGIVFPVMTQKVYVNSLPEKDKTLLKKGLTFATYKDMLFFLENYE